jgi:hypothetical protein
LLARFFVPALLADFFPADFFPAVLAAGFHGFAAFCFAADFFDFFAAFLEAFFAGGLTAFFPVVFFLAVEDNLRWVMA